MKLSSYVAGGSPDAALVGVADPWMMDGEACRRKGLNPMHLTVLTVPGCPNAPLLEDRLALVLAERTGVSVSREVIGDESEAAKWGMHGSPTLLIDGADPFAGPGQAASMSCRLYRDAAGNSSGAPSVGQLRQVIDAGAAATAGTSWLDSAGRAGRGRIAPAERGLRAVHQAVLRSFIQAGTAPRMSDLAAHAAPFDAGQVLGELADGDFLCLDQAGHITAAYPFSALPTAHRVQIEGHAAVYSMCAIDALGISAMTSCPAVVESADPSTGEPVTVVVDGARGSWNPAAAVVYAGRTRDECAGPSASVCCGSMNFFASEATAAAWAASHPEITGGILDQDRALETGIAIFGELLR